MGWEEVGCVEEDEEGLGRGLEAGEDVGRVSGEWTFPPDYALNVDGSLLLARCSDPPSFSRPPCSHNSLSVGYRNTPLSSPYTTHSSHPNPMSSTSSSSAWKETSTNLPNPDEDDLSQQGSLQAVSTRSHQASTTFIDTATFTEI